MNNIIVLVIVIVIIIRLRSERLRLVRTWNTSGSCASPWSSEPSTYVHGVGVNMKHIRGLLSTTQALRRTFTADASQFSPFRCPIFHPRSVHPLNPPVVRNLPQLRFLRIPRRQPPVEEQSQQLKDERIGVPHIQLVNEEGHLDPPAKLRDVLNSINRAEEFVLQVSPTLSDRPPVCKIMNKAAIREYERTKAKAAKVQKSQLKQIELNWCISNNDLSHRMKQLATFLEKGRKVEVLLTLKKRKRAPTMEEAQNTYNRVMEVADESNAGLVKPMEGVLGKQVLIILKRKDLM